MDFKKVFTLILSVLFFSPSYSIAMLLKPTSSNEMKKQLQEIYPNEDCTICLGKFVKNANNNGNNDEETNDDELVITGCGHIFHADCLKTYMNRKLKEDNQLMWCPCPMCKGSIKITWKSEESASLIINQLINGQKNLDFYKFCHFSNFISCCYDEKKDVVTTPCGHAFCRGCFAYYIHHSVCNRLRKSRVFISPPSSLTNFFLHLPYGIEGLGRVVCPKCNKQYISYWYSDCPNCKTHLNTCYLNVCFNYPKCDGHSRDPFDKCPKCNCEHHSVNWDDKIFVGCPECGKYLDCYDICRTFYKNQEDAKSDDEFKKDTCDKDMCYKDTCDKDTCDKNTCDKNTWPFGYGIKIIPPGNDD